jgi:UDP-2,3-diacylglucosamine hydrolase
MDSCTKAKPFYRFIADVHLTADPVMLKQFCHLLNQTPASCQGLYILGDLFDHWLGSDIHAETYRELQTCFKSQDFPIYFLPGNKDFLLEDHWLRDAGVTRIHDPYCLNIGNKNIILTHGDQFCTNDRIYQWFRWLVRKPLITRIFLHLPKKLRLLFLKKIRRLGPSKKANRYVLNQTKIWKIVSGLGGEAVILGHVHHPGDFHQKLLVLPDWRKVDHLSCFDLDTNLEGRLHL